MRYKLQCEFCHEVFVHTGSSFPDECPLCHAYVGLDGKPEVTLPAISLKSNRAPDDLYRQMERGAEHRMQLAAEATGSPVSDFAHMKQTNMKDNLREGDTSAAVFKPPADMPATFSHSGTEQHAAAIAGVRSGPFPNAGASQIPRINQLHQRFSQNIVASGRQN